MSAPNESHGDLYTCASGSTNFTRAPCKMSSSPLGALYSCCLTSLWIRSNFQKEFHLRPVATTSAASNILTFPCRSVAGTFIAVVPTYSAGPQISDSRLVPLQTYSECGFMVCNQL